MQREAKPPQPQPRPADAQKAPDGQSAGDHDSASDSPESIFESLAEAWDRDPERWDGLE
jgi:hypothetical protein